MSFLKNWVPSWLEQEQLLDGLLPMQLKQVSRQLLKNWAMEQQVKVIGLQRQGKRTRR